MRWSLGERGEEREHSRESDVIKQEVIRSVTEFRYTKQYKEQ